MSDGVPQITGTGTSSPVPRCTYGPANSLREVKCARDPWLRCLPNTIARSTPFIPLRMLSSSPTTIHDGMATVILPRNPSVDKTFISFGAPSVEGAATHAKFSDAQRYRVRQTTATERSASPQNDASVKQLLLQSNIYRVLEFAAQYRRLDHAMLFVDCQRKGGFPWRDSVPDDVSAMTLGRNERRATYEGWRGHYL